MLEYKLSHLPRLPTPCVLHPHPGTRWLIHCFIWRSPAQSLQLVSLGQSAMIHKHGAWRKLAPLTAAQSDLIYIPKGNMENAFQVSKVTYTWKGHGCCNNKQIKVYNHENVSAKQKINKKRSECLCNEWKKCPVFGKLDCLLMRVDNMFQLPGE